MEWNEESPFQALALTGGGYRGLFTAPGRLISIPAVVYSRMAKEKTCHNQTNDHGDHWSLDKQVTAIQGTIANSEFLLAILTGQ